MPSASYQHELEFAVDITGAAMGVLQRMQGSETVAVQKDVADIATTADLASEKLIIEAIRAKFPDDGIHSEEAGDVKPGAPRRWIIDPLDGTKEYAKGLEEFNVLVGLEENGKSVMGVIRRAGTGELYTAADDVASYNGNPIRVTSTSDLSRAFIGLHIPTSSHSEDRIEHAGELLKCMIRATYRVRCGWDTAKQCGWIARGLLDGHIICPSVNKWHDVMEGLYLVECAGGKVTDFRGEPIHEGNMENGFIISNGILHEKLRELVGKIYK